MTTPDRPTKRKHRENALRLTVQLFSRRDGLKLVYGEKVYGEVMASAKKTVRDYAKRHDLNYVDAALAVAKNTPEPVNQFVLVAAVEICDEETPDAD